VTTVREPELLRRTKCATVLASASMGRHDAQRTIRLHMVIAAIEARWNPNLNEWSRGLCGCGTRRFHGVLSRTADSRTIPGTATFSLDFAHASRTAREFGGGGRAGGQQAPMRGRDAQRADTPPFPPRDEKC
jgi:hypothetical protein